MKFIAAIFVAAVICLDLGCHIPAPVFDIGVCTAGKLGPQIAEVKPKVLNCLRTDGYATCLAEVAKELGPEVGKAIVVCTVREFTGVGATPTSNPDVRERARAYLDAKGVTS